MVKVNVKIMPVHFFWPKKLLAIRFTKQVTTKGKTMHRTNQRSVRV